MSWKLLSLRAMTLAMAAALLGAGCGEDDPEPDARPSLTFDAAGTGIDASVTDAKPVDAPAIDAPAADATAGDASSDAD